MTDILMATYNGEKYIKEQIESLIKQTYQDWKLYIHDDGSKDKTLDIIKSINDNRIILIEDGIKFGNSSKNFLHIINCLPESNNYIFLCDQDDVWLPQKLEKTLEFIKGIEEESGNKVPVCVGTDLKVVDKELNIIDVSFYNFSKIISNADFNTLLIENVFTGCTMCFNRSVLKYLKNINGKESDIIQHDWIIGLICAAEGKIGQLCESTMLYRQHGDNEVGAKRYSILRTLKISKIMLKIKKIKNLKKKIVLQLKLTSTLIVNPECKKTLDGYVNTKGLKHKRFLVKNNICRSKNTFKSLEKLLLY